ncbi:ABC transporter permease [Desulfoferrobacter suflitae]|jgi:putative ABC transport system permease protein|uniref:ABC transporter permease n=1 Tax=Desulfoferrobacter suflitae TaxID=2865782 RepID=UPI0021646AD2|nr:ABC transporter permease [Desulfoferrobacter suflitae]MCK8604213.1 ABC transporter permease [Desulfoferrobacter suflitae]MDY0042368.1 ABC transporter permease [Desulforhabdus sp.]
MTRSKLVIKNITRKKSRFLFTIFGIAVGIASLVTLLSLGAGLESEVRRQSEQLGAELVVTPKGWCAYEQISVLTGETLPEAIPNEDVEKVAGIKGITAIPYLVQRTALRNQPVPVVGILSTQMMKFKKWEIDKGEYLLDGGSVVTGFGIARQFELNVGDALTIRGAPFRLSGILKEKGNRDDLAIYMDLATAQRLYQVGDMVSFIAVKVDDITRIDGYSLEIQERANVAVVSDKQLVRSVLAIVGSVRNTLQLVAAVAILAACFGIINTMVTAIHERKREIGILQALGAGRETIFSLFLYESAFYGFLGGVIGIVGGVIFSYVAAPYITQNEFTAFLGSAQSVEVFNPDVVGKAMLFSLLVASLSGIYPAFQASRLSPVEAISYE